MKKLINKNRTILSFMMVAVLLISLIPSAMAAESGSCGNGVTWTLSDGNLTVSGNGAMYDYGELNKAPWMKYADSIRSVTVSDGVTKIGSFAFYQLQNLTAVTIADTVQEIGNYAFLACPSLVVLDLGKGIKTIGQSAFELCTALKGVRLPNSLQTLRFQAFYRCESLLSIIIPASVTTMESTVFAYCTSLCTAVVHAGISELPHWTFYGCTALESVTITENITTLGAEAFKDCDNLTDAFYGGSGDVAQKIQQQIETETDPLRNFVTGYQPAGDQSTGHSSQNTEVEDGKITTTDRMQSSNTGSIINAETVTTQTSAGTSSSVVVDAILEAGSSWEDADKAYESALNKVSTGTKVDNAEVNIYLKEEPTVSGSDLSLFAGDKVELNIHTSQGAVWHINGEHLSNVELAENYRLSFTLFPLKEKNDKQWAAVGGYDAFTVVFDGLLDFKVEVELPLGEGYARSKAVFFSPEGDAYQRMQAVVVDMQGLAHFYLGYVTSGTEYLIGINVGTAEVPGDSYADAIIPDTMHSMYPELEFIKPIEYVITGQTSSWGMNIGQVTLILVAVLVVVVGSVGAVMFTMNKRRLKNGYVPKTDDDDEEE